MGRVDDALRRAAEGVADEAPKVDGPGVIDTSFPSESSSDEAVPFERSAVAGGSAGTREPLSALDQAAAFDDQPAPSFDPDNQVPAPAAEPTERTVGEEHAVVPNGASGSGAGLSTKLVGDERMLTTSREQYRRLAASLHHMQEVSGLKVILIASAVAGEGKTLTAANLALTFSESYERDVLLIDADLRRPSLARTFGIPSMPGLSDGLVREFDGKLPLQQVSDRLAVLPAGRATADPMAGLTSERMKQLVNEARAAFDWVILDTPPIGLMTDASLLSAMADGVVLVVKAGSTPYEMVRRAVEALGSKRMLGVVLNRATTASHGDKYYDYYHYNYAPSTPEPAAAD
jgi:capsular exopolysaccharide synthesis family protein